MFRRASVWLTLVLNISVGCSSIVPADSGPQENADPTTVGGKADVYDDRYANRYDHPHYYGYTLPPQGPVRFPGEFEPARTLLLSWQDGSAFSVELATVASRHTRVTLLVGSSDAFMNRDAGVHYSTSSAEIYEQLDAAGANLDNIHVLPIPTETVWMRDYGPIVVLDGNQRPTVVDSRYYPERPVDDRMPTVWAQTLNLPVVRPQLDFEGGNILSDGRGRCVTTERMLEYNEDHDYGEADVRARLREYYGCENTVFIRPLLEEGTGHVDMAVHISGPARALVGAYRRSDDVANARRLDEAASRLKAAGFTVTRIPMPPNDGRETFRSYTNALAINSAVIVPVYPGFDAYETPALEAFRAAYPNRQIVPIDASQIIWDGGAVHCVTMTVNADIH